jgi:glycerol-3-phosphate dehydrogenase
LEACLDCEIPVQQVAVEQALRWEPMLNPSTLAAFQVPDGVFDPYRFCLSFLASAQSNGAKVYTFTEITGIDAASCQVKAIDRRSGNVQTFTADAIVNAAGPWVGRVARLAGADVEVEPSAGAMVTVDRRVSNRVLNLLAPPGDGDIIIPQRNTSILGTTSWTVADPDHISIPPDHLELIFSVADRMVPGIRNFAVRGVMAAARPLLVTHGAGGRSATRGFACFQTAAGLFSVVGGKTTTARLMAEVIGNQVAAYLNWDAPCNTRRTPLLSHRKWPIQPLSH